MGFFHPQNVRGRRVEGNCRDPVASFQHRIAPSTNPRCSAYIIFEIFFSNQENLIHRIKTRQEEDSNWITPPTLSAALIYVSRIYSFCYFFSTGNLGTAPSTKLLLDILSFIFPNILIPENSNILGVFLFTPFHQLLSFEPLSRAWSVHIAPVWGFYHHQLNTFSSKNFPRSSFLNTGCLF